MTISTCAKRTQTIAPQPEQTAAIASMSNASKKNKQVSIASFFSKPQAQPEPTLPPEPALPFEPTSSQLEVSAPAQAAATSSSLIDSTYGSQSVLLEFEELEICCKCSLKKVSVHFVATGQRNSFWGPFLSF